MLNLGHHACKGVAYESPRFLRAWGFSVGPPKAHLGSPVLLAQGVKGYDFGECLIDYRLSLLHHMQNLVMGGAHLDISNDRAQLFGKGLIQKFDSALSDHNVAELMPR